MRAIKDYIQRNLTLVLIICVLLACLVKVEYDLSVKTDQFNSSQMSLGDLQKDTTSFDNKFKCKSYEKDITDNLETDQYVLENLYQIFYSPVLKTCLSAEYDLYTAHGTVGERESLVIRDVLAGNLVWFSEGSSTEYWNAEEQLDEQINKLK